MLKRFIVGLSTAILSFAAFSQVPLSPLGNTHLNLGGGSYPVIPDTNGVATLNGKLSSTFYVPNNRTNTALTIYSTNVQDGQTIRVAIDNNWPTNVLVGFTNSGSVYSISTNRTGVFELTYSAVDNSYRTRHLLSQADPIIMRSNSVNQWPIAAPYIGASMFVQSNHVLYLLTSSPTSASWSSTNKIGP